MTYFSEILFPTACRSAGDVDALGVNCRSDFRCGAVCNSHHRYHRLLSLLQIKS